MSRSMNCPPPGALACPSRRMRVTVRIEEEADEQEVQTTVADNPMFGMWQDREEVADVAAYARRLRAPRYNAE